MADARVLGRVFVAVRLQPRNAEELVADADLADSVELQPEALSCIGDLIVSQPKNLDALASKVLGEEPQLGPALNSLLRIILRTSSMQEFVAADYVFKCFCEENPDGQAMLVSTLIPQPMPMAHAPPEEDVNMSLGSMLLQGLTLSENDGDLEVLRIEIEAPTPCLGSPEPLLHRMVKYLALASSLKSKDGKSSTPGNTYVQPIVLKLLVTWLSDCPSAVHCFLVQSIVDFLLLPFD